MANRSYIFSIDFDRTKEERNDTKKVCGLSEYPYRIPLSYKILVSQDAKISDSIIWDYEHPIAIIADFYKGRQKLFDFLNDLLKKEIFEPIELEGQIKEAKKFLFDNAHENKYIILECGEIFEMETEKIPEENKKLFETEIINIDETIEKHITGFQKMKDSFSQKEIETEMWSTLGIDFWDEILFYCFE